MKRPDLFLTVAVSSATSLIVCFSVFALLPHVRPELATSLGNRFGYASSSVAGLNVPQSEGTVSSTPVGDEATIQVVRKSQPAVVAVYVTANVTRRAPTVFNMDPFDPWSPFQFPSTPTPPTKNTAPQRQRVAGGSGFFVSSDGLILTNKHVVKQDLYGSSPEYTIQTVDGKTYPAKVLSVDPVLDLAFMKVEGSGFPYLEFADSEKLVPGQTVIAIGNALDEFRNSVTKGVVSGLNRRIVAGDGADSEVIEEAVQTDAAINPGNSGGPLLDLYGKVVGLNTAVSGVGQSLGFALPSNTAQHALESVKRFGHIVRPFLGVRYTLVNEDLVKKNQLSVDHGALVSRGQGQGELAVSPGSPADKAGIVENDIILDVNGVPVDEVHSLASLIGRASPGDKVKITVVHAGAKKTIDVTLDEMKP